MALFTYRRDLDPVNALFRLQAELQRVRESAFGQHFGLVGRGVFPPLNVFKSGEDVVVRLEVPGFAPEDLSIESRGQTLVISGKPRASAEAEGSYHRRERTACEFSRSLELPRECDPGRASASCRHGVLTVTVPAHEAAKSRQIDVTQG